MTNIESGVPRRDFSKVTDNQATELYFEEIFEQGFATGDPLFDLRNYFYPESEVALPHTNEEHVKNLLN